MEDTQRPEANCASKELGEEIAALLRTFEVESAELVGSMELCVIGLEQNTGDTGQLDQLFGATHTLKGSAASLGLKEISGQAHELEDRLEEVRGGAVQVSPDLVTELLGRLDSLRGSIETALATTSIGSAARFAEERPGDGRSPGSAALRHLNVDIEKLDRVLELSGEITVARGRLAQALRSGGAADALELHEATDRLWRELQGDIMRLRAVPLEPALRQMARTVRDVATAEGKAVQLSSSCAGVEVDAGIIVQLRDCLTHLLRNAVAHGIESAEARRAAGKAPVGRIDLRATQEAGMLLIEIADDGAGFNREAVVRRARERGLLQAGSFSDADLWRLAFEPGFSTADSVTAVAGRGVGLDVVRRGIESLRGTIAIESARGKGATFRLRLPLTLSIIDGLHVGVMGRTYVVPIDSVVECLELPPGERRKSAGGVVNLRSEALPYLRLSSLLGTDGPCALRECLVVVQHVHGRAGLVVDALLGKGQAVVKPLGQLFESVVGITGSAILGDGKVALIVDVPALLRLAIDRQAAESASETPAARVATALR
ncbi:MAG TPA: chemotaxis protein CheA [Myxococcales bacterium]|nr:chemotaxis protein CheA [Myxococcales bacterium]